MAQPSRNNGDELVGALLLLTKDKDARVRLAAIQAALDRGWGRPIQGVDLGVQVEITRIERIIIDPKVIEHVTGAPQIEAGAADQEKTDI